MNSERARLWLVLAFVGIGILAVYFVIWGGESSDSARTLVLERSMSSAPTVSRENQEHELEALARELEKKPDHTPVLLRMAQLSREVARPAEAIRYLRMALKLEPSNPHARLELGRVLYESGDLDGAIDETTRLLELDPKNVDALYNLGAIYGNMMDNGRARELWEQAVALDPDSQSGRMAALGLQKLSVVPPLGEPSRTVPIPDGRRPTH